MKNIVTKKTDEIRDVVLRTYIHNNILLEKLFIKQLSGTITYDELKLQYKLYKTTKKLETVLLSQIETNRQAA